MLHRVTELCVFFDLLSLDLFTAKRQTIILGNMGNVHITDKI